MDQIEIKKASLAKLMSKAETGEDWADICLLSQEIEALGGEI